VGKPSKQATYTAPKSTDESRAHYACMGHATCYVHVCECSEVCALFILHMAVTFLPDVVLPLVC